MRVAIIAPPWVSVPPSAYGGVEAVLDSLARALAAAGVDVLLCTTGDSSCPVPKAWTLPKAAGVGVGGAVTELRHVIDAYEVVGDYDIVHDHSLVGPFYAERFPSLPVVTTNHGPFQSDLGTLYRAIARRVPIIAVSHDQALAAGDIPVTAVVHHGVDPSRFPVGSGGGGYALFLGRMSPDKGVDTAIRAARAAGMPLRIAAKMREGPELDYFHERVEPLLGGTIEYLGEIGGDAKLAQLGAATCLLNPMAWPEPFGMVMIEALACGTPVVATPCGAAPEIIEDGVNGFLRADVDGLAEAMGRVDELDRDACRRAVEGHFSARRMGDAHLALYEQVVGRWSPSRSPGRMGPALPRLPAFADPPVVKLSSAAVSGQAASHDESLAEAMEPRRMAQ